MCRSLARLALKELYWFDNGIIAGWAVTRTGEDAMGA